MTETNSQNNKPGFGFFILLVVALGVFAAGGYMMGQQNASVYVDADKVKSMNAEGKNEASTEDDPVVAIVNGEKILRSKIFPLMQDAIQQGALQNMGQNPENFFNTFVEQYALGKLVTKEALEAGFDRNPAFLTEIAAVQDRILRNAYLIEVTTNRVTEEDIAAVYKQRVTDATPIPQVRARHILVEDEAEAKQIIKKLKDGADFADLAKEKSIGPTGSNGGDLGFFARTEMVKEFADAAFALEVGRITEAPVQTQFGWHVIQVEEKREAPKPTLEQARETIIQQLRQQELDEYLSELQEKADIQVFGINGDSKPATEMSGEDAAAQPAAQDASEEMPETSADESEAAAE
jgi:peptidyl-prolyl cis-trans isomerase C